MTTTPDPTRLTAAHDIPGGDTLFGAMRAYWTFPSTRIIGLLALTFLGLRASLGPPGWGDLIVACIVFAYWPFQEWFLHVHALHFKPRTWFGRSVDPYAARMHRYHHHYPWLVETIFLPTPFVVPAVPVTIAVWWLIMPTLELAWTGVVAYAVSALVYEWVHYLVHMPYKPRSQYFQRVWRNHRLHHFKSEHYWHAFTVPWVDTVMGTNPDPATVEKSATVRDLGVDDEFPTIGSGPG